MRRPATAPQRETPPVALQDRAAENLRFIRDVMARAAEFTAVPGWGGVVMGLTALAAAGVATRQPTTDRWLAVWAAEAALAIFIGAVAMFVKAGASGQSLGTGPARRFALAFAPPSSRRRSSPAPCTAPAPSPRSRPPGSCSTAPPSSPAARTRCARCRSWASASW